MMLQPVLAPGCPMQFSLVQHLDPSSSLQRTKARRPGPILAVSAHSVVRQVRVDDAAALPDAGELARVPRAARVGPPAMARQRLQVLNITVHLLIVGGELHAATSNLRRK